VLAENGIALTTYKDLALSMRIVDLEEDEKRCGDVEGTSRLDDRRSDPRQKFEEPGAFLVPDPVLGAQHRLSASGASFRRKPILDPREPSRDLGPVKWAQLNITSSRLRKNSLREGHPVYFHVLNQSFCPREAAWRNLQPRVRQQRA